MRHRPHASDRSLSASAVTRAYAIRDAEPLSAALKKEAAASRLWTRRLTEECILATVKKPLADGVRCSTLSAV
jgi:hypothetical protein